MTPSGPILLPLINAKERSRFDRNNGNGFIPKLIFIALQRGFRLAKLGEFRT